MRTVKYTNRFKRDYRREKSGQLGKKLDALLTGDVDLLAADTALPHRNVDHALTGEWVDHRDCHIRPDLVLIYRKPDGDTLELVRLGLVVTSVPKMPIWKAFDFNALCVTLRECPETWGIATKAT